MRGLPGGGAIWADTRVVVAPGPLFKYYHGTNGTIAALLLSVDLTPMFLASVAASAVAFDWTRPGEPVTDFAIHGPREHGQTGLVALYGIESPGLTAALAIGEMVASLLTGVSERCSEG